MELKGNLLQGKKIGVSATTVQHGLLKSWEPRSPTNILTGHRVRWERSDSILSICLTCPKPHSLNSYRYTSRWSLRWDGAIWFSGAVQVTLHFHARLSINHFRLFPPPPLNSNDTKKKVPSYLFIYIKTSITVEMEPAILEFLYPRIEKKKKIK